VSLIDTPRKRGLFLFGDGYVWGMSGAKISIASRAVFKSLVILFTLITTLSCCHTKRDNFYIKHYFENGEGIRIHRSTYDSSHVDSFDRKSNSFHLTEKGCREMFSINGTMRDFFLIRNNGEDIPVAIYSKASSHPMQNLCYVIDMSQTGLIYDKDHWVNVISLKDSSYRGLRCN
jgi:hypothetical protein